MTRQEAIEQLEMVAKICTTTKLAQAALMGARAIERDDGEEYLRGKADGIRECHERLRECHERLRAVMGDFGGDADGR